MTVLKCKMCGGDLELQADFNVCECEYCGSKQTVPTADNDKKMNLFARANRLRYNCEFDAAIGVYESIVAEFPEEAEAYWGKILSRYGVEYVDDSATGKKVPTCHRSSFDSVMDDVDFELVMEYADLEAKRVYREDAKQIEELRKGILEVSSKEEPYDIFICYKETDENGERTLDSVLAQDLYKELTEAGYKVFFSRITLEDKLGQEYEPYIFAALHSAKIMLAIGTKYEYYDAVWVKNEWGRFLKLMGTGEKKTLIPCYKDLDAYDMPKQFAKLQAQDLGKVGATQDLLRGIEKILGTKQSVQSTPTQAGSNEQTLLKRAYMLLEDGKWDDAAKLLDQVLTMNPENADAYVGQLLWDMQCRTKAEAAKVFAEKDWTGNSNWRRAVQFADSALKTELNGWEKARNEIAEAWERKNAPRNTLRQELQRKFQINPSRQVLAEMLRNTDLGESIQLGRYKQGGVFGTDRVQPIEWILIQQQGNKYYLLSKYVLEWKENIEGKLYDWLNKEFLEEAFSEKEKILLHNHNAYCWGSGNSAYVPIAKRSTRIDRKIGLLSSNLLAGIGGNVGKQLREAEYAQCKPTLYATSQNPSELFVDQYCDWWCWDGKMEGNGQKCSSTDVARFAKAGVRPAIVIDPAIVTD